MKLQVAFQKYLIIYETAKESPQQQFEGNMKMSAVITL
jgi:hypothetical protein